MIAEFTVGRHSKASTVLAYKVLAPGTHLKWLGYLGVLACFLILDVYKRQRQLRSILYDKELQHRMEEQAKVEAGKKKIEWGSQIRSYVFDDRREMCIRDRFHGK